MDTGTSSDVWKNKDFMPSSSNEEVLSKNGSCIEINQLESTDELENLVKILKCEKKNLSQTAEDCPMKTSHYVHECCLSKTHLLLTSLINAVTSCRHSVNVLHKYIEQNFLCSRNCLTNTTSHKQAEMGNNCDVHEHGLVEVPIQDIIHALVQTLHMIFKNDFQLGDELKGPARKGEENSCDICELKTVLIIIHKMFLFQCMGGNKEEMKYTMDELPSSLPRTNISRESHRCPLNDNDSFLPESFSSIYLIPFVDDGCSFRSDCDDVESREDLTSESDSNENGATLQSINTSVRRQYLKITYIESSNTSDEFCNENGSVKSELNGIGENDCVSTQTCVKGKKCNGPKVECKLLDHPKFWMSLDSFPKAETSVQQQTEVQNKLSSHSSKNRVADSNEKPQRVENTLNKADNFPPNKNPTIDKGSSFPNSRTTSSSFTNPSNCDYNEDTARKIRTDTVEVKMTNRGEGFGLILGVKYNSARSSIVPVIHSIKPKSPAQKSGVLKVDDRILSINHQDTLGLTPTELKLLNKQSFMAEAIILKVEFDVVEARLKFGTFDVILDKTLKIGLVFEDIKRGFPMTVSGIVKGSGAHRCGQLFPGDKIKFFRCIRNEEFDPVSCSYSKEESVLITVQRDPAEGPPKKYGRAPPYYSNPCYSHVDLVPRRGKSYLVRSTTVHAGDGTEALVLDQEVTLIRDPVYWDFGFLVGEDPDSGRAYVTGVRPEGPAADSGAVKKFDRIVQVNGVLVDRNIENSVLALLSQANHKVDLLIRRPYREDSTTV